ncbi:hypothetical protein [Pseudomonas aeruginosa]|uniref:hypothetical protein n=1 Tax=Pseudomonas aeruginosa TaxID=287 RepID=UPI001892B615|nr:hypothetical protein [Pseudomonas aeruginosa]
MQTLGARFQMRRVSLEPGRQPEAGMGSQIVERARLCGLASGVLLALDELNMAFIRVSIRNVYFRL